VYVPLVSVDVSNKLNVADGVPVAPVLVRVGVGVIVGVLVTVGVSEVVDNPNRAKIWEIIPADSGELSIQSWISDWSIAWMAGRTFGSDEIIFCPEVNATFPAAF
jgi:hypothetical protein